jgi:tetratricopeptide (TPR) repeat protein
MARAQERLLWGGLEPGPHAVGFQALYRLDSTRQYNPPYPADPERPPASRPRPVLVCVWYPARATPARPIAYREYLEVPAEDPLVTAFARRLAPSVRDVVCEETIGKKATELTGPEAAAFERLLAATTFAVKDAPAADGRFPVVIYHPGLGGSYEDNSVLFEYLASHGYVVVSSAYPRADASDTAIDWDLDRSFRDMEFLGRQACERPFADAGRLAAAGHSFGAQAAVAWAFEPSSALRAVVSLDSTVENMGLDWPGFHKLRARLQSGQRPCCPVMLFASKENNPRFATWAPYLKFAPRYEATVTSLDHDDYLTHGAVRPALLPEKWPDANKARALRGAYERVCEHVLQFLDATLKQRSGAREFLRKSLAGRGEDFRLRYRPAAPAPPTARQLAALVRREGAGKAAELLRSCRDDIDAGGGGVGMAGKILADEGAVTDARALLTRAVEIFPTSGSVQASLGDVLARTDDRKGALAAYRRALELIPRETGDERLKARRKAEVESKLKKLESGEGRLGGGG